MGSKEPLLDAVKRLSYITARGAANWSIIIEISFSRVHKLMQTQTAYLQRIDELKIFVLVLEIVKLREREGQRVNLGRSLKGHF